MALLRQGWRRHSLQGHQDWRSAQDYYKRHSQPRCTSFVPLIPPPTWNNEPLTCGLDGFVCWRIRFPMTFARVFLSVPMVSGHNCFGSVLYPVRTHFEKAQQPIFFLSLNWNRCRSQQQTVRWQMSRKPCLMYTLEVSPPHTFERLAEQAMKCTRLLFQRT